jgi:hypothetical protein
VTCRYVSANQPRVLPGRHGADCAFAAISLGRGDTNGAEVGPGATASVLSVPGASDGFACVGCLPCPEPHCRICGRNHAEQTCADCLNDVRNDLAEIVRLCDDLPIEAEIKGIDSEAANLAGPAADWETWHHVKASVRVGRLPEGWQETADHELHPLFVLGGWDAMVRDALEHDEPNERVTITLAAAYVSRQLTYLAGYVDLPFEDLARDLRQCRAHIERVLHDGEQRDTGAPCMTCRVPLERVWGSDGAEDGWRCPRCRETSTESQYRFLVSHLHLETAQWLTDQACAEKFPGVRPGTIREWARRGLVARRRDSGRVLYAVLAVESQARLRGLLAKKAEGLVP